MDYTAPPQYGAPQQYGDPVAAFNPAASAPYDEEVSSNDVILGMPQQHPGHTVLLTPAVDEVLTPGVDTSKHKSKSVETSSCWTCTDVKHDCCPPDSYWRKFLCLYGTFFGVGFIMALVGVILLAQPDADSDANEGFQYFWASVTVVLVGAVCICFGFLTCACQCGWDGDLCCCC